MTITEADAVNKMLTTLVATLDDQPVPGEVVDAAVTLADRANKALGAGWTGERIRRALNGGG